MGFLSCISMGCGEASSPPVEGTQDSGPSRVDAAFAPDLPLDAGAPPDAGAPLRPGWNLTFADEFDQADGTAPNPAWWNVRGKNNQVRENVFVRDGKLVLKIEEGSRFECSGKPCQSTSARVDSEGKLTVKYGRIEARILLPTGSGLWPAFWTLGADYPKVGFPKCGEVDIVEGKGSRPRQVISFIHGPGYTSSQSPGGRYDLPSGALSDDFHVYAMEWSPGSIRFFFDELQTGDTKPADLPANAPWVFDHDFFLILTHGTGFFGGTLVSSSLPSEMLVDYVRVFEKGS